LALAAAASTAFATSAAFFSVAALSAGASLSAAAFNSAAFFSAATLASSNCLAAASRLDLAASLMASAAFRLSSEALAASGVFLQAVTPPASIPIRRMGVIFIGCDVKPWFAARLKPIRDAAAGRLCGFCVSRGGL
jgi:hypothetical protein